MQETVGRWKGLSVSELGEATAPLRLQEGTYVSFFSAQPFRRTETRRTLHTLWSPHSICKIPFLPVPFPIFFHHLTQNEAWISPKIPFPLQTSLTQTTCLFSLFSIYRRKWFLAMLIISYHSSNTVVQSSLNNIHFLSLKYPLSATPSHSMT